MTYFTLVTCTLSFLFQERAFKSVNLSAVLVKCNREDGVEKQPLYIDEGLECIKCPGAQIGKVPRKPRS